MEISKQTYQRLPEHLKKLFEPVPDEIKEIFDAFGEKTSGAPGKRRKDHETHSMSGRLGMLDRKEVGYADKGGVSRFFYCAKVKPKERGNSKHPTIKPLELMRYLTRLITPKGGMLLDPFAGTGVTGEAAAYEGFDAILIEREAEYIKDCQNRLALFLD